MEHIGENTRITATGYKQTVSRYQAANCHGCPVRAFVIAIKETGSPKLTTSSESINKKQKKD